MNRLSIEGYSFHGLFEKQRITLLGTLESIRYRYNVGATGMWSYMMKYDDAEFLAWLKDALAERDMVVSCIIGDGGQLLTDNTAPGAPDNDTFYKNGKNLLSAAIALDAKCVRLDWGIHAPELNNEQYDFIANRYREYCKIAEDHGFMVGPENHYGASTDPDLMLRMRRDINSPAYGVLVHLDNWVAAKDGKEEQGNAMLAPYAMHMHLPAWTVEKPDLIDKLRLFVDAGYKGYYSIEHHSGEDETVKLEWHVATVKKALMELGLR